MSSVISPPPSTNTCESFLDSEKPLIMENLNIHHSQSVAGIIADYVIDGKAFGSEDWEKVFGVKIGNFELDKKSFYEFWFAQDAVYPDLLNCETHFPPVLIPQTISSLEKPADTRNFNLRALFQLVQNLNEGHQLRFSPCFKANALFEQTQSEPPCWVVAHNEVLFRGQSAEEQVEAMKKLNQVKHASYEILPSALPLATVTLVHYLITGKRYLGTPTEKDPHLFQSRCKEIVQSPGDIQHVIIGGQSPTIFSANTHFYNESSSYVDDFYSEDAVGVAGLRKFKAIEIQPNKLTIADNHLKSRTFSSITNSSLEDATKTSPTNKYRKITSNT